MRDVIRTCIGCRGKFPQPALIRFTNQQDTSLCIDTHTRRKGRGAYLCPSSDCIRRAFKAPKRINFLLRAQLSNQVIAAFERELLQSATPTEE